MTASSLNTETNSDFGDFFFFYCPVLVVPVYSFRSDYKMFTFKTVFLYKVLF